MTDALGPILPGATVGLVATAGPAVADRLDRAIALLERWGLTVVVGDHVRDTHPRAGYLAGSDRDRADDLTRLWCDDGIDAVLCIRGGYGSVRVLDLLDAGRLRAARPKPLFGSSDVTALHEYWQEMLRLPSWFAPMVATLDLLDDPVAIESLRRSLFEPAPGRVFRQGSTETLVSGTATGILTGGNLSLLAMTIGARGRPAPQSGGRIALLEDVTEDVYRLDSLVVRMLRSGWFDGVTGIALGSWRDCGDLREVRALMFELLEPLGVPVVWELGFGHGTGAQSIPLGVPATLLAQKEPRLVLH